MSAGSGASSAPGISVSTLLAANAAAQAVCTPPRDPREDGDVDEGDGREGAGRPESREGDADRADQRDAA
ncbi:hypothetical protein [Streptomyces sp. ICBB 8177]|uniref:hypothetical protein n=1 Tax=Streptomyces sp. ICBB 8177 TaxID=563922 RepID=UPI000D682634|nr:hypothetical protein [Streptomyces sp. ICBB 8177]PWI43714.1 hypothetical protein CK485_16515 [Streptomyces sp. ICBB 8177]